MGPVVAATKDEVVYLGLGSNLGDRDANLVRVLALLEPYIHLEETSSVYDTDPLGYSDQPNFLNCVCSGRTTLEPGALLESVKAVEQAMGREPSFANGPRLIDVDILFYGRRVVAGHGLQIPHPRLAERAFMLVPLAEIAARHVHPELNITVAELLDVLRKSSEDEDTANLGVRRCGLPPKVAGKRSGD